jgi:UDP-N-acetylmuramoylalanine--D-glutamate ligase
MSKFNLDKLKNKKIAILGLGSENLALIKFLISQRIKTAVTICDARSRRQLGARARELGRTRGRLTLRWRLGKDYDRGLKHFDIIMRSPGYPLFSSALAEVRAYQERKKKELEMAAADREEIGAVGPEISSPMKMFFSLSPTKNIIGVTGTKGKGTTASLIYAILKEAKKRVWLGGNIGTPPFAFIRQLRRNDWVVLELSSFQLEDMCQSPKIAVLTNFYPEHLAAADPLNPNYHRNLEEYWRAKLNILAWQDKRGVAIINKKLENKKIEFGFGSRIYFTPSNLSSCLVGKHNKENIGAAVAVARVLRISQKIIRRAVEKFSPLPHRLELVRVKEGVKYYNDSFATTPDATIVALTSFCKPIILIAGGADKNSDFSKLAQIVKTRVTFIFLLPGKGSKRFKKELLAIDYPEEKIIMVKDMTQAVRGASIRAGVDKIVLLSPACASFGLFRNYKERGDLFKKEVKKI